MNKSTLEEHLFQPSQTNKKQFKIAVTFLSAYNGSFNVTNIKNKFYGKKALNNEGFIQIRIPEGAYEIDSLDDEIKRIIDKSQYTSVEYPFKIKPIFSTLGSIITKSPQGSINGFVFDDSIGNLLGFNETILWEEYNLSPNPVDILSFDKIFIETDIAQGMIFKGKRSGIIHNFTMDVEPGYKYIEKVRGCVQWYMMDTKDFISSNSFISNNENKKLVSFNGQNVTFRLSIKVV